MKKTRTGFSIAGFAATILLLLTFTPGVSAQDYSDQAYQGQAYNDEDPPTRAGRIGYVDGSVSFQPGGEGDWVTAVPNRPLTVGDNLWVDRDSRAEIQIGSTSIRLGPETSIALLDLGNNVTQVRLSLGSLYFRIRHNDGNDTFEVDTPNLAFNVYSRGAYRLDVNQNGDQTIAEVYEGEGEITGAGNSYRLVGGQRGTFSGVDQLSYDVDQVGRSDDFYRWARSRDERQDRFRSANYVSMEMTGYEDLDDYGQWQNVSGYGNVWTPAGVPYDWAPYRYGHWVYVAPWGWTWVEDEPWGFAPFHYGRWAYLGSRWCWVPGPVVVTPVYAPALVAFIGGGGFSVGVGVGSGVGWFPLAPGEVYVPWYRTSPRYVQNVNVTNTRVNVVQVTNVYNNYTTNRVTNVTYINQRVTNSVTVVNHDTFVNARPVNRNIVRVDARQIQRAQVTPSAVTNVQPARQSLIGVARPVNYRPPQQAITRQVFATRQPVVATRPMGVPNVGRVNPPPLRTVRAVPVTQAQPLERGARGTSRGGQNEAAPRQGTMESNRPPAENNRGNPRPNVPENNPTTARPTSPENRPGAENNRTAPRPGAAENNPGAPSRPGIRENRPGAENNPGARNVPRPNAPENNRNMNPGNNPDNRPVATPRENEPSRPNGNGRENRDITPRPETPENQPTRPDNRSQRSPVFDRQPEASPDQPRGNSNHNRSESTRPPETPRTMPEQPARPPETRQEPPQRSGRNESVPRPEARPAEPPHDNNHQGGRNDQGHGNPDKGTKHTDNEPPKYH